MAVKEIEPVLAGLSGVRFDSGAQSVAKYASAISELSLAQQKVALSASGLNETQVESVLSMNRAAIAAEGLSVKEAAVAAGMSQKKLAMKLGIQTTDNLTSSTLLAAVAEGKLTQEQYESIVAINANTAATAAQGAAATTLSAKLGMLAASAKATFTAFLTTPAGIITLVSAALPLVAKIFDKIIVTAEEANEAMEESFSSFEEATGKVESLNKELETTQERIRELEAKDALTFVEQSELEKLRETNKLLQIQADLAEKDRIREAKDAADDTVTAYRKNFSHDITAGAVQDNISYSNSTGNNAILVSDETDISAMLAYIEQMKKLRDEVDTTSEDYLHYQGLIDDTTDSIWAQTTVLQGYASNLKAIPYNELTADQQTALEEINNAIALVYNMLDPAKWREIQLGELGGDNSTRIEQLRAESSMLKERNELLEEALGAIEYYNEVQNEIAAKGIDPGKAVFGNIDLNNRQVLEWTDDAISKYQNAIDSWGDSAEDLIGTASTVLGTFDEFDGIPIAFSPMLQTENGAVYLDQDTVYDYIWGLIEKAGEGWNAEDLFRLDTEGLEFNGVKVKNLLADIGDTAEETSESMHFLGKDGAINDSYRLISKVANDFGLSVDELIQKYGELNAEFDENDVRLTQNEAELRAEESATESAAGSAETYEASLSKLSDTISGMKSAYELLNTAQDEMNTTGGLSADTIAKLASSCDNYMDFLYEENGLIKLNTEAWRENADAKIKSDMAAIQREIRSIESQNALLEQEKNDLGSRSGNTGVQRKISEINDAIRANNAVIEENQRLYSKYESIYRSVTNAASGWASTLAAFDGAASALGQLAAIQAEITDGYTVTAAKAREFAAVYPEILNKATVSADGQIALNESVVNSFLQGKEAEIRGAAQAEAEKLKAKQALLQAELSVVQEQIAAAESGDDAIVKSANDSAQARITLEQAVLSACEQAGIDETTANQLALAAMTGDWDTFQSLAIQAVNGLDHDSAIAFNSVMTNFAITSQNMVDNTNQVIGAFNQMGKALQNAMNGVETELYSGSTSAGNVSGTGNEAVKGLLAQMFEEWKSGYPDSEGGTYEGSADRWKQRLQEIIDSYANTEPDLSGLYEQRDSLNKQIADIQNQIGLLDSLGNTSLDKFKSDTGKSGSGGSGSGSGSSGSKEETKGWLDTLNDLDSSVGSLSGALKELNEEGSVSTKTLSGLSGAFGKLSSFNSAINAMGKSGATIGEAQEACNALAEELIRTSGILDMVTDENAEVIASALEAMGVTNARALVLRKFNNVSASTIVAENGLSDAAWEQVEAFLRSTGVTEDEIKALQALRAEQYNAALAAVDFTKANAGVTEELIRQAKAAGAGADQIEALIKIQKLQAMGKTQAEAQGAIEGSASFEDALVTLAERARIEIGDINVDVPDVNVNVAVSGEDDKKSANEKYNESEDSKHDLKIYGTVKAYEAATYRFSEATEKFRQAVEAVEKVEADIEMAGTPEDRFAMRFDLIDALKKSQETNSELIKERKDEIDRLVKIVSEDGVEISYDPDKNELIFPKQADGTTADDAFKQVDMEKIYLNKMLNSPNFEVTPTGFSNIDGLLYALSDLLREQKQEIEKLNEQYGTDYSVYDFRKNVPYQRIDGSTGYQSQALTDAVLINNRAIAALELGNIEEYKKLRAEYEEIAPLIKNIEAIMEHPVSAKWQTVYGDSTDYLGYQAWEILEKGDVFSVAIGPGSSGGVVDNLKEMMSINETYQEAAKNMAEDAETLNEENIKSNKELLETQKKIHQAMQDAINDLAEVVQKSSQALDTIQDVYSTLKQGAKEFEEYGGYLTLDTYQKILELGPQYMSFLMDENGQWVINEERIRAVTAAKAKQLAIDNAWTYVERLRMALEEDSIENLNELLYATKEAAEGTWDLVYANLAMLDLDGEQYEAALHNIQVMRDLAYAAIDGIGIVSEATSDSVGNMRDGLDDILHYVMDMLKQKVQDQIDALEDMKDAYNELIDAKKKSLDATKSEESYEKKRAKQLKEIAKLQARIDMLSLDDSREAQAEKTKLLEQMADLQENLSDTQSDYAIDNQKDALDKMKDAYDKEKDAEIKKLEDSISSQQKIYEMAIDYIKEYWENDWDALKQELLQWNYDVGSDLEKNLVAAWENATAAAQKYGDFVSAMDVLNGADSSGEVAGGNAVANRGDYGSNTDEVNRKVIQMKQNSLAHLTADSGTQKELEKKNLDLSKEVAGLMGTSVTMSNGYWMANGSRLYDFTADELLAAMKKNSSQWLNASGDRRKELEKANSYIASMIDDRISDELYLDQNGVWWLKNAKKKLYEVGSLSSFHTGGTVGWSCTLRDDEVLAKLQTGETVLTRKMWENAVEMVDRMTKMTEAMSGAGMRNEWMSGAILRDMTGIRPNTVTNITNDTRPVEIHFGDTIINGATPDAVEKHREISREMMNEIARRIRKP